MASVKRSFGWVQNPSNFKTLKNVVGIFDKDSSYRKNLIDCRLPLIKTNSLISDGDYDRFLQILGSDAAVMPYEALKGRGCGTGSRAQSMCSGIVQACIDGQRSLEYIGLDGAPVILHKLYSDDWTADGFLRWAVSLGLLEYSYRDDSCRLSEMGKQFIDSEDGSKGEYCVLTKALMSYPPIMRVMSLLAGGGVMTKFEIGSQLGFKAELGFTSISQDYFIALWNEATTPKERAKIRANIEGDSDKYARMICSWLAKMGWIESHSNERVGSFNRHNYKMTLLNYSITPKGLMEYKKACGGSSNPRIPKTVMFEMLATKAPNAGYLRYRRAILIEALSKPRTIEELAQCWKNAGVDEPAQTITDDMDGLMRIGLDLIRNGQGKYRLRDKIIGLRLPSQPEEREEITDIKERVRQKLIKVSHDYLILIDLAYSDATNKAKKNLDARNFEIYTSNLLTKELSFDGQLLGGSDKPDIIIWKDGFGIIVDNKSYKDGFSIGRKNEDEICRYIDQAKNMTEGFPANNWWKSFCDNGVDTLHYLFVTSFLNGSFLKNLRSIHQRSGIDGGAVGVVSLLCFAEHVKRGNLSEYSLPEYLNNAEVVFHEIEI